MVSPSVRDDAYQVTWGTTATEGAMAEDAIRQEILYLGNRFIFPAERPRVLTFLGDWDEDVRHAIAIGVRPLGWAVEVEPDTVAYVARSGPASIVWYGEPAYQPLAQFWAHRAGVVFGGRFVAVGDAADYAALEAKGAVVPSVVDFGGSFPIARDRSAWIETDAFGNVEREPRGPIAGGVQRFRTPDEVDREILRMHELVKAVRLERIAREGAGGQNAGPCGSPPAPPAGSAVDVVFYTGYESVSVPEQPLDFYNSATTVVPAYTDAWCGTPCSGDYCRPNVVPRALDFRQHAKFTAAVPAGGDCDQFFPVLYKPESVGYACNYDTVNFTEENYLDEAVKTRAREIIDLDLKAPPNNYTIRNVVIVAHWLDIPYRERMFPHRVDYRWGGGYKRSEENAGPGGADLIADADDNRTDADNDVDACSSWQESYPQNFSAGNPHVDSDCDHNTWLPNRNPPPPSTSLARDPDQSLDATVSDDHFEGDTGNLDYLLADHEQRAGEPYAVAHAGYGRITGHTSTQAVKLVQTADAVIGGTASAPHGSTAMVGVPESTCARGAYDSWKAIQECRYGPGSLGTLIVSPCSACNLGGTRICPNECQGVGCANFQVVDLLEMAQDHGEFVQIEGHSLNFWFSDHQEVQFNSNDSMVESNAIKDWTDDPNDLPPGVWTVYGSNVFGYTWVRNFTPGQRPCEPDGPCWLSSCSGLLPDCTSPSCQPCLDAYRESSFVDALVPAGVLAIRGSFAGHGDPLLVETDYGIVGFNREVARSVPLGKAQRIATNEGKNLFDQQPYPGQVYEAATLLVGDPLAKLGVVPGSLCPNAPVFVAARGSSPVQPQGIPQNLGYRKDGVPLEQILDYNPFIANPAATHGSYVSAGDLNGVVGDLADEITSSRGPKPDDAACNPCGADSLVAIHDEYGRPITSFMAFPGVLQYGTNAVVGSFRTLSGRQQIVVGRGADPLAPAVFRVFENTGGGWGAVSYGGTTNVVAYSNLMYGVNVWAADVDGDGYDEVVTGPGPGPTYGSEMRFFDVDGTLAALKPWNLTPYAGATFGVVPGSGDFDNDGVDEATAGKGPSITMDAENRIYRRELGAWVLKVTIPDPFGLNGAGVPGTMAGSRSIGYEGDGTPGHEILIAQGPVTHLNTDAYGIPPSFQGSKVRGFDVTTGTPWGYVATPIFDRALFSDNPGEAPVAGVKLTRFSSPQLSNPFGMRAAIGPLSAEPLRGTTGTRAGAGSDLPVSPDRSAAEIADDLSTLVGDADGLLKDQGSEGKLQLALGEIAALVRAGQLAAARLQAELLVSMASGEIANKLTLAELAQRFSDLVTSVDQHILNTPPVPHPGGPYVVPAIAGQAARVRLDATGSVDADSTPGTADNIRHYRWYDAARNLLGDEVVAAVELWHQGGMTDTVHVLTLEVEDAYGAIASVPVTVTMTVPPENGGQP